MTEHHYVRSGDPDQKMTKADFSAIAALALREFGISLPDSKLQLVQSRLARRLKVLDLPDFSAYRRLLEKSDGAEERNALLSALTTNVTKFFREIHHFDVLMDDVMPDLVARARNGERIRIWSAGCSSGQEPYSIALCALRTDPDVGRYDFKILATDIDPVIVDRARKAEYDAKEIEQVEQKYFRSRDIAYSPANGKKSFTLSQDVRSLVTFRILNLISDLPFSGQFDVIFCRNVAIYFDKATQKLVWGRFSNLLKPDGFLFIGHSERVCLSDHPQLISTGITAYRKSTGNLTFQH